MPTSITITKNLQPTDINSFEFKAYKNWVMESGSSSHSVIESNFVPNSKYPILVNGKWLTPSSSLYFLSIYHSFYKDSRLYGSLGTYSSLGTRILFQSASIFSFPRIKVGNGIKKKSFRLQSTSGSLNYDLRSNSYGDIYDIQINTDNIISNTMLYEGFNRYYDTSILSYDTDLEFDEKKLTDRYITGSINNSLTFVPGVLNTVYSPIGYAANFTGTGSFTVRDGSYMGSYNKSDNYAISLFISASDTNSQRTAVCKHGSAIPFHVTVESNGQVGFYVYSSNAAKPGTRVATSQIKMFVTSSTSVTSSWNHVVCQKSGSYLQILINGSLEASKMFTQLSASLLSPGVSSINNPGDLYIGGFPDLNAVNYNYIGKLDEFRLYNKSLTTTECGYLNDNTQAGTLLQTNIVGNVFDKHGIAVITSANPIYQNITQTPYTVTYKSTVTRYEYSALIRIRGNEFNVSTNNSLVNPSTKSMITDIKQDNSFLPYITTIGLYDNSGNLLMIGKLGQPIKKRSDVDLNILVRVDLDLKG